jgi:UDP-N-acetylmuramyl-tripeptide synthetase
LAELCEGIVTAPIPPDWRGEPIAGVFDDSRLVQRGGLFVAVNGAAVDGRKFVADAVARGARVVIAEAESGKTGNVAIPGESTLTLCIPNSRRALALLAARWFEIDRPGKSLKLLGVTGTNGKSTTAFLVAAILRAAGMKCGMLGTVQYDLCGRTVTANMTTPGPLELCGHIRECHDRGASAVVMEVSSHALDQERVAGLSFTAAAFTNLTGDHLDYHHTFEAYRDAKAKLFAGLTPDAAAVINRDDPTGAHMAAQTKARVVWFSLDQPADIRATITQNRINGTFYRLHVGGQDLVLENAIVGKHNVYNAMTAAGLALAAGATPEQIQAGLMSVRNIPGRLQRVPCVSHAEVFVDYAHTDDALDNVLSVLRPLTNKRLICVFGCGGDRDRTKRPRMARVACRHADVVVVTSDNPRTEDPNAIIAEICSGLEGGAREQAIVEADRAKAIRLALSLAGHGDVVLIAGKGHESYQIIGQSRIHFDDVEVAIQAARELANDARRVG